MSRSVRHRTALGAAALSVAAAGLFAVSGPSRADDAGVSGGVDAMVELAIETKASGEVEATVTSTISKTRLEVTRSGATTTVEDFSDPVTNDRNAVRAQAGKGGDITLTYGPQAP